MKCLMRYGWVKLIRSHLPEGKGILGMWARLSSRAAFRKGIASYCGYENEVVPGMWSGGIVGVKSILGVKSRKKAFETLDILSELGYIRYTLDVKTKKLTYQITDWVIRCSGEECMNGTVYTTDGYGFLCMPRNITERLIEHNYIFEEADAWLDLWCHSVSRDRNNAFSFFAPTVQYGKYGAVLTLETLGKRWGWEKTKVWRFFKKYGDVFTLYRLPGSYGSLIFNTLYPTDTETILPEQEQIGHILDEIRKFSVNTVKKENDHQYINRLSAWYSRRLVDIFWAEKQENRVAVSDYILRAYISLCWSCENCKNYNNIYDCGNSYRITAATENSNIRGPCKAVDLTEIAKEFFTYE